MSPPRSHARRTAGAAKRELADILVRYNGELGAPESTLAGAAAMADADTCCVHTGQQAGFMGGPAYTLYKIVTAIRLAHRYQEELGCRCVPVFWLASEDHDLGEINHAHYLAADGSVGRVRFDWDGEGRSISELPVTPEVQQAAARFFESQQCGPFEDYARELFMPRGGGFARSLAAALARLFGDHGLVVLEPHLLRPLFPEFFARALALGPEVKRTLEQAAAALAGDGYPVPLDPARAGTLFHACRRTPRAARPPAPLRRRMRHCPPTPRCGRCSPTSRCPRLPPSSDPEKSPTRPCCGGSIGCSIFRSR